LRLDVEPPPQVLQTDGRHYQDAPAFHVAGGVAEQQGPIAPRALPRFIATAGPSVTLSPSAHFPGALVIGPTRFRRFRGGARRASPVAGRVLVPVLPLPPRRRGTAASARLRRALLPSPPRHGLGLRILGIFEATSAFTLVTARGLAHHPHDGLVDGLQKFGFPSPLPSKLRGLWLLPRRDSHPLNTSAFSWTHAEGANAADGPLSSL